MANKKNEVGKNNKSKAKMPPSKSKPFTRPEKIAMTGIVFNMAINISDHWDKIPGVLPLLHALSSALTCSFQEKVRDENVALSNSASINQKLITLITQEAEYFKALHDVALLLIAHSDKLSNSDELIGSFNGIIQETLNVDGDVSSSNITAKVDKWIYLVEDKDKPLDGCTGNTETCDRRKNQTRPFCKICDRL